MSMTELRMRSKLAPELMEQQVGRMLRPEDVDVQLRGPSRVLKPDGQPLCVYLPGALNDLREQAWEILHTLKGSYTSNRGYASGSERVSGAGKRTYARAVDSAVLGAMDPAGPQQYCRLTAWTGKENERWRALFPLFQRIGQLFQEHVPDRFDNQYRQAMLTEGEWLVPGTPFTTITVNNTYATAVHTDKGDLESGFSTLAVLRRGDFQGGWICFPEYRVGADMQDGDLLLMDAHAWHGNTPFDPMPDYDVSGRLSKDPGFERISIVSYFRTNMVNCGSAQDEAERERIYAENRAQALVGE
jgi:hypothetical protein